MVCYDFIAQHIHPFKGIYAPGCSAEVLACHVLWFATVTPGLSRANHIRYCENVSLCRHLTSENVCSPSKEQQKFNKNYTATTYLIYLICAQLKFHFLLAISLSFVLPHNCRPNKNRVANFERCETIFVLQLQTATHKDRRYVVHFHLKRHKDKAHAKRVAAKRKTKEMAAFGRRQTNTVLKMWKLNLHFAIFSAVQISDRWSAPAFICRNIRKQIVVIVVAFSFCVFFFFSICNLPGTKADNDLFETVWITRLPISLSLSLFVFFAIVDRDHMPVTHFFFSFQTKALHVRVWTAEQKAKRAMCTRPITIL